MSSPFFLHGRDASASLISHADITSFIPFIRLEIIAMASNSDNLSFLTSNKGKPLLLLEGFLFKVNKETKDKTYWTCRNASCRATVHTDGSNTLLRANGEHDHLPQPEEIQIQALREKMKNRALNETVPIARIYEEEVLKADLSTRALASLPLAREMREFTDFVFIQC